MSTYNPYIKPNYKRKDGKTPIYIRYYYDRKKRVLIPVGINIDPKHWNFKKNSLKRSCPNYEHVLQNIQSTQNKVGQLIDYAHANKILPTPEFIQQKYNQYEEIDLKVKKLDIFSQLDDFISLKKGHVSNDTIKDYNSLRKHLQGFEDYTGKKLSFHQINYLFYNQFVDYLTYHVVKADETVGLRSNTIGKQIKNLKIFLRDRIKRGIIQSIDLTDFKVTNEEVDNVYLSENELDILYKLYLENKDQEIARDFFLLLANTGLRYNDLKNLRPENIDLENQIISKRQSKVNRTVVVPMIDYVPDLLKKYNYQVPNIHLNELNSEIKKICKKAGFKDKVVVSYKKGNQAFEKTLEKWELVSSHTGRRSFCTNMYLDGELPEEIMKLSGHKSPAAFLRYIKIDNMMAAKRLLASRKRRKTNEQKKEV